MHLLSRCTSENSSFLYLKEKFAYTFRIIEDLAAFGKFMVIDIFIKLCYFKAAKRKTLKR